MVFAGGAEDAKDATKDAAREVKKEGEKLGDKTQVCDNHNMVTQKYFTL